MGIWRIASFFAGMCLSGSAIGCAFTLPTPPEVSRGIAKQDLSNAGRLMSEAAGQVATAFGREGEKDAEGAADVRNSIASDVVRCEQRLDGSVAKMNLQRTSKGTLTIIGATLSTGAGIAAAILTNTQLVKEPQTATAIVAAGGGLVTIITQAIGDPAGELQNYQRNLDHYNRAVGIAEQIRLSDRSQFFEPPDCQSTADKELPECIALTKQAEDAASRRFGAWRAVEIRALSAQLRSCADTQSSAPAESGGGEGEKRSSPPGSFITKALEKRPSVAPKSDSPEKPSGNPAR